MVEVVEVVEVEAEPDPARALKVVESPADVTAQGTVEVSEEDLTPDEVEASPQVGHIEEVAAIDEGSDAALSVADEDVMDQVKGTVEVDLEEGQEVGDFFAGGPQVPVSTDEEGAPASEVVPDSVAPLADEPAAQAPAVEELQAEVPQLEVTQVEAPQPETSEYVETQVEEPEVEVLETDDLQEEPPAPPVELDTAADSRSDRPRRRLTARLGTLLLDAHLISGRDLDRALEEHQASGERLGHYLVDKGMVEEKDLAGVLSDQYGVPAADVENMAVPAAALMCIPEKMARRHMVLPLSINEGVMNVAMLNPSDIDAIKDIEFTTGLRVQPLIVTEWALERAIQRLYSGEELRAAQLSGGSAKSTGLKDPKAIIRRMVRDRDEAVMQSERDPQSAYELAASIDEFVDEMLKVVEQSHE